MKLLGYYIDVNTADCFELHCRVKGGMKNKILVILGSNYVFFHSKNDTMKQIFFSVAISSMFLIGACNDAGTNADEVTDGDSSASTANANADMYSRTGLPLGPDQEVPATSSTATGSADVSYNPGSRMLVYTVNWTGLTGEPTMAHIHGPAARGENAGPKHDLSNLLVKAATGSFTDSVMVGNDIKEDSLLLGHYYFNIHTAANPGGEIRGQIEINNR